jgi:hypothetical protein
VRGTVRRQARAEQSCGGRPHYRLLELLPDANASSERTSFNPSVSPCQAWSSCLGQGGGSAWDGMMGDMGDSSERALGCPSLICFSMSLCLQAMWRASVGCLRWLWFYDRKRRESGKQPGQKNLKNLTLSNLQGQLELMPVSSAVSTNQSVGGCWLIY